MQSIILTLFIITILSISPSFGRSIDPTGNCSHFLQLTSEGSIDDLAKTTDLINTISMEKSEEAPVGDEEIKRVELFRFEKDYNPKNILHYGIKINTTSCTIATKENGAPNFSNYWSMGEEDGHSENMTSDDLERLGPVILVHDDQHVTFKMNAMDQVNINKKEITIQAQIVAGECRVSASAELNDGRKIIIEKFYAEISSFLGIPTGINSLRVDGHDPQSGAVISQQL